jgi:hypothetical protein
MADVFPRLLDAVHLVEQDNRTLLSSPRGRYACPAELARSLRGVGPLLDGSLAEQEIIARVPQTYRPMVQSLIRYLEQRGALRLERRVRPEGIRADLLALIDEVAETGGTAAADDRDAYERWESFSAAPAMASAPSAWHAWLAAALGQFGLAVTTETTPDVRVTVGSATVRLPAEDERRLASRAEREVMAAVIATEAVARSLGAPARPLPEPGAIDGLSREGKSTCEDADLLGQWPTSEELRRLVVDPASLLPTRDEGRSAPAMVRPCAALPEAVLPWRLRELLRCVHAPLRWERGAHAHGGARAHRGVASARALHPVELYVVADEGAWYLNPIDLSPSLVSGHGPLPETGVVRIAVTVRESKVAYRYATYATRLCAQESGLVVAAVRSAAAAAAVPARVRLCLSERGPASAWGARLQLGADERVTAVLELDLGAGGSDEVRFDEAGSDEARFDEAGLRRHLDIVRTRRSGHLVFNSIGTGGHSHLGELAGTLARLAMPPIDVHLVTHRPCTTTAGSMPAGAFVLTPSGSGVQPLRSGTEPTRELQRGQDGSGWLAPDYGSAVASVLVSAPDDVVTRDIHAFYEVTAAAAQVVDRALLEAARLGLAGRIHNSLAPGVAASVTGLAHALPLFQVIIGAPRADGTLVCGGLGSAMRFLYDGEGI